jgi:hypothetical protein
MFYVFVKSVYTRLEDDSIMLYLTAVTEENHGVYECVGIENGETKEFKFEFVLRSKYKKYVGFYELKFFVSSEQIQFVDTPKEQSIRANSEDIIVCRAEATPGPQISWLKNKVQLKNSKLKLYKINLKTYGCFN